MTKHKSPTTKALEDIAVRCKSLMRQTAELRETLSRPSPSATSERPEAEPQDSDAARWRDLANAPRDGTMVWLLVDSTCQLADASPCATIGFNINDHDGLGDKWLYVAWNWEQDCFHEHDSSACEGSVLAWAPLGFPLEQEGATVGSPIVARLEAPIAEPQDSDAARLLRLAQFLRAEDLAAREVCDDLERIAARLEAAIAARLLDQRLMID
jgi:hypothetical protein